MDSHAMMDQERYSDNSKSCQPDKTKQYLDTQIQLIVVAKNNDEWFFICANICQWEISRYAGIVLSAYSFSDNSALVLSFFCSVAH